MRFRKSSNTFFGAHMSHLINLNILKTVKKKSANHVLMEKKFNDVTARHNFLLQFETTAL